VVDDQSRMSEEMPEISQEMPEISLPGHVAPPIVYDGPQFPVQELQPLSDLPPAQKSSDELASSVKQADVLQREVIDWLAYSNCV